MVLLILAEMGLSYNGKEGYKTDRKGIPQDPDWILVITITPVPFHCPYHGPVKLREDTKHKRNLINVRLSYIKKAI